jgi:hypothetical protein
MLLHEKHPDHNEGALGASERPDVRRCRLSLQHRRPHQVQLNTQ